MSDTNAEMRSQLQKAVAYRDLCRAVSRSGRENIFWAIALFAIIYYFQQNPAGLLTWVIIVVLVGSELAVGLFKWFWPCAQGFLFDGLVLLIFAFWNLVVLYAQQKLGLNPIRIFFAGYMGYLAIGRFRAYGQLLKMFAQRPTAAQLAWFEELVHEIRTADPQTDDLVLDLPGKPHWKAKLLGTTIFFVSVRGNAVVITGPADFEIIRHPEDHGTGSRAAVLMIHHNAFPTQIGDASWDNYEKWRAGQPDELEVSHEPTSFPPSHHS